jgi:tripartite-type tricarboxylate transporter receptor subunit TctC
MIWPQARPRCRPCRALRGRRPIQPGRSRSPVGPSGSYDIVGRALADQLAKRLDQTVVVENRARAGTVVGTQAVIQSPADGYTLLVGGLSNVVFNVGLYNKPPYSARRFFVVAASADAQIA